MRSSARRSGKYSKKITGTVLPGQGRGYLASLPDRTRLESVVKSFCTSPVLLFSYISYAEQLVKTGRTYSGSAAFDEAIVLADKWQSRGLAGSTLRQISAALGFEGVPPYPPPERFGYEIPGGNGSGFMSDVLRGSRYTCPKQGAAVSLSAYLGTSPFTPTKAKFAIYNVSGGVPSTVVDETPEINIPAVPNQWFHADVIGGADLHPQDYFLIVFVQGQGAALPTMYHDVIAAPAGHHVFPFNGFPSPMPGWTSEGVKDFSIYCTFQPD